MSCIFECDGCGKRQEVKIAPSRLWLKPHDWYERSDEDGGQVGCSRDCIRIIAEKTGKTDLVSPI